MSTKVAIVTGASAGIGESTVALLLTHGYRVYAGARRVERMKPLAEAGAVTRSLDVTDDASMTAFVDVALAAEGRIDVLVNNAGYGSYGALEDVAIDEARRQFEVNVFGLARMTQLVLPTMRSQHSGYVVNISSIGGKIWEPLGSWYHATKFAVEGLSDSLRVELKPHGIHVVVIEPGSIATEWRDISADHAVGASGEGAYAAQAAALTRVYSRAPGSSPDVVAGSILKAVSSDRPRSRYAIGQGAKPIAYALRVLPDRAVDAVVGRVYKVDGTVG